MTSAWTPEPIPVAAPDLPTRVTVYEVGPRDGLQAEPDVVDARVKAEFCRRLVAAGIADLEVTSFVAPGWIPQLADAEEVVADLGTRRLGGVGGVRRVCLVPNHRGLDRALAAGVSDVAVVASATDAFAHANLNADRASALHLACAVAERAAASGLRVRGYVSMAFGDPWEGPVDAAVVAATAAALSAAGCATISLGDTIGVAAPGQVLRVLDAVEAAGVPRSASALHLHDTYGQALANVVTALHAGITEFDASAGGLGRCPYARGATGNLATEDLVWMLHGLGIETGIDLAELVRTTAWMAQRLGRTVIASRVATALLAAGQNDAKTAIAPVVTTEGAPR